MVKVLGLTGEQAARAFFFKAINESMAVYFEKNKWMDPRGGIWTQDRVDEFFGQAGPMINGAVQRLNQAGEESKTQNIRASRLVDLAAACGIIVEWLLMSGMINPKQGEN